MIKIRTTIYMLGLLTTSLSAQASFNNNNVGVRDEQALRAAHAAAEPNLRFNEFSDESSSGSYEDESEESSEKIEEIQIQGSTWEEMKPKLEKLIEETIADPRYEERLFAMDFTKEEQAKYIEWSCDERKEKFKSCYPIGICGGNRHYNGSDPTISMTFILRVSNYTLREE